MDEPDTQHRLTSAAELVQQGLGTLGGDLGRIVAAWPLLVGERLARVSTPASLRDGRLRVRCASASWAQAINGIELQLLERLDAQLAPGQVTSITARAGGPAPRLEDDRTVRAPLAPLPEHRIAELRALVAHVADAQLRERLLAAAIAAERRRLTP
jgi:predicted nucleic acid-binding Zn ribbon protein